MNSDRIQEIQAMTGYPESRSVQRALLQVWNECAQDADKRIAELETELSKERIAESDMEFKYEDAKRGRDQALKRVAELEEQIETQQGLRGVLQRAERAEHERDEAEKKITGLETKVAELEREVRITTSRLSGWTQRARRAESAETLVKMLQDRNSYMEQTSQLNWECMKLQDEISKLELDLRQAEARIAELGASPAVAVPEQDLVRLDFMVDPDALKLRAFVPDPVRVLVTDPASIFITGILGESGRKMVASGMVFIMTRSLAEKLISHHVAIESRP